MNEIMVKGLMAIIFCTGLVFGNPARLEEVGSPDTFLVTENYIYIGEKHRVHIYSLDDFKLIKTFGRPGEGPGEFKLGHGINSLSIDMVESNLAVGSIGKLSLFTPQGDPIKELRIPAFQHFIPLGNGFISSTFLDSGEGFQVQGIALYDREMKRKRILVKTSNPVGMGVKIFVPKPNFKYLVYKNNIYLSGDLETISIRVFDLKGNPLRVLQHQIDKRKIPANYIEKMKEYYRTSPNWKNFWNYLKQYLTFPDHFPAVRDFFIDQDLIYIQTYQVENQRAKWLVFNLQGKLKGNAYLPVIDFYTDHLPLQGILNGYYYYLEENIDEEIWALKRLRIKPIPLS